MGRAHAGGERHHDAGGGDGRHGCRTGGETDEHGHQPACDQRVHGGFGDGVGDHVADAGVDQRLLEAAACGDDQDDAGHGAEGLSDHAVDGVAGELLHVAKGDHGEDGGDEQCHERGAEERDHTAPGGGVLTGQIHDGRGEHQHDRQQDHGQGGAEGRAILRGLRSFGLSLVLRSCDRNPLGGEPAEQRAGDDDGRDGHDQAEGQGDAEVRVQRADGGQRTGVRRHEGVQRGQAGEGRDAEQHHRGLGTTGGEQHHRYEDDHADLEEHRDAHDERDQCHGPRQTLQRCLGHDGVDDGVRTARLEQDGADDRAERDKQAHVGNRAADAGSEAIERLVERHARAHGHDE